MLFRSNGKLGGSLKLQPSQKRTPRSLSIQALELRHDKYALRHTGPEHPKPAYQLWRDLVSDYSKRSLSQREDKLRAVSGLAKIVRNGMQSETEAPDEYLAGLWRREFHFDLTWRVAQFKAEGEPLSPDSKDRDGVQLRNPTWSWASVDGAVDYSFSEPAETWKYEPWLCDCIQVQSVSCLRELSDDETSAVISGRAILTGSRVPVELAVVDLHISAWIGNEKLNRFVRRSEVLGEESNWAAFVRPQSLRSYGVFLDRPRNPTSSVGHAQAACWTSGRCQDDCCVWGKHHNGTQEREEVYCFQLFSWQSSNGKGGRIGPETWFLVLTPSATIAGAFERIGIGWDIWNPGDPGKDRCVLFKEAERVTIEVV